MRKKAGETPSSTLAIGAATLFVMLAALISFVSEDRIGRSWSLRGTLVPSAEAQVAR